MRSLLLLVILVSTTSAAADTLLVEKVEATADTGPDNGVAMATVERRFGTPETRHDAVGDPPITRWDYPEFSVYFEHDRVIHSVARR